MVVHHEIIEALQWRYGVKEFDNNRRIHEDDLSVILESMRLSPSAFGLQPWKFYNIESEIVKEQLGKAAPHNKIKIESASCVLVLARRRSISNEYIDHYFAKMQQLRNQTESDTKQFYDIVTQKVTSMTSEELNDWTARQVYIALSSATMSAALLKIDACPMEGIDPVAFDDILNLTNTDYATTVGLTLGYRSPQDKYSSFKKIRFNKDEVFQYV